MKNRFRRLTALLTGVVTVLSASVSMLPKTDTMADAAGLIKAFPGAVGGGSYATGGRGGTVVHVTNLNDSGTGSFRDAVSQPNRIVVFDVSGTIELKKDVVVSSNVTIAGQTAPGGAGITLKNFKLGLGGENCIVRFISSRPGERGTNADYDAWGGANGANSIVDHCSLGWANDEQWGLYSKCDNLTVQYSVIGPSNSFSYHSKGIHGFGIMLGRANVTWDHNLIVHNVSRNYRGKVTDQNASDFTNNVIYNWGYQTAYGTIAHVNYAGNTLKLGPSTNGGAHYIQVSNDDKFKVFLEGNRILNMDDSVWNGENANWSAISFKTGKSEATTRSDSHFPVMSNGVDVSAALTLESAADAYNHVIDHAGNGITSDTRTAIDQQVAYETRTGTGYLTGARPYSEANDSQKATIDKYKIQCGVTYEYPSPVLNKTITDSDNDGMPDDWELARGLNPKDPSDVNGDYCGQGYTNIEYYLNDLTVDAFPAGVVTLSPEKDPVKSGAVMDTAHIYQFRNVGSGLFLEVAGGAAANGTNVQQGSGSANGWMMQDAGDGYYRICSEVGDGKTYYLDLDYGKTDNGTNIGIYSNTHSDAQLFKFLDNGDGTYTIATKPTKDQSCIGIAAGSKEEGANVVQWARDGSDNQKWMLEQRIEPLEGTLIRSLLVQDRENDADWSIVQSIQNGDPVFGDRDAVYTALPAQLAWAEYIRTACDSKNSSSDLAVFTAGAHITVYTALDSRVTALPAWLKDWTATGLTAETDKGVQFVLYSRQAAKGEQITLGSNGQSSGCVGYAVFAVGASRLAGDVNGDGAFSIADADSLQKWLCGGDPLSDWQAGDLNGDGRIDSVDLCMMKRML